LRSLNPADVIILMQSPQIPNTMIVTDLLPMLQSLSRAEKLRIMQFLVSELAKEENVTPLENGTVYRVWSPYGSHEAAHKLAQLLEEPQETENA
jgi:hypothetical protein